MRPIVVEPKMPWEPVMTPLVVRVLLLIVFAVMVPVAVRVPTVVEPRSAEFAMKEVVAVSAPMVRLPVLMLDAAVPQPNFPEAKVYVVNWLAPEQSVKED